MWPVSENGHTRLGNEWEISQHQDALNLIDYAGPVHTTRGRGKGYTRTKTYVAVFVCMSSRAVHLELAADASTPCFLAALERFCGRRGTPKHIFTDNGSNFRGARAELRCTMEALSHASAQSDIHRWSAEKGVTWHFQPAYAPNFGGLWEAGVKVMKNLIRKSLHDHHLNAEQLNTILISAEAVMNSRPYLPVYSTDEEAFCPLTPGHLLINRPLTALPQLIDESSKIGNVRNWNLVKLLKYQHWQHFRKSYLPQLSQRAKNMVAQTNLQHNDVVLVSTQNTSRNYWPLGLVVEVFPGADGLVRAADIRINKTVYRRSVRHLVKMPIQVQPSENPSVKDPQTVSDP